MQLNVVYAVDIYSKVPLSHYKSGYREIPITEMYP